MSLGSRARLPLTVIGGFLGAGKTTLLNGWLKQSQSKRLAVLVNDFGALNIDAELVAARSGDTIALSNGCVCCSIGDDLTDALIRVIESPTPFDAVVIEASGVSDPWRIAQVGLADPGLALEGVLVLVDAAVVLDHSRDPRLADTLVRQLLSADLIVLNKIDLVNEAQLRQVREWLGTVAGGVIHLETTQAAVSSVLLDGSALLDLSGSDTSACGYRRPCVEPDHPHAHADDFDSWVCQPQRIFPAAGLRALLSQMPSGVLRLKGVLRTDEHGWAELQFAGRHGSLRRAVTAPRSGAAIVAIGLRGCLPVQALDEAFRDVFCANPS